MWSQLLKDITDGVENGLNKLEGAENEPDNVAKIIDQFRLDVRSLPATLNELTMEDVRQVYLDGNEGQPMSGIQGGNWGTCIFLLADAEVLQDPDLRLLDVVDAKYDPVDAVPKHPESARQRNFGWLSMPTKSVLDFYNWMDMFTFEQIVVQAWPEKIWDPADHN